jgi:hypothetical protein
MKKDNKIKHDIKIFLVKLISITISFIVIISFVYNTIFADKIEKIFKLLELNKKENVEILKSKIRSEVNKAILKDKILDKEDIILLKKFYNKIKEEIELAQ